ncbi:MAG: hypothetical protein QW228_08980 [Candidatus Aenigmatarchaeota archaeon]
MVNWWKVGKEAFDVFINVRETIAFYMFIIEESIQAMGMACYLLKKYGLNKECKEYADFTLSNLINPLEEFASGVGTWAYPMNEAYKAFATASRKVMEAYKQLPDEPQSK